MKPQVQNKQKKQVRKCADVYFFHIGRNLSLKMSYTDVVIWDAYLKATTEVASGGAVAPTEPGVGAAPGLHDNGSERGRGVEEDLRIAWLIPIRAAIYDFNMRQPFGKNDNLRLTPFNYVQVFNKDDYFG